MLPLERVARTPQAAPINMGEIALYLHYQSSGSRSLHGAVHAAVTREALVARNQHSSHFPYRFDNCPASTRTAQSAPVWPRETERAAGDQAFRSQTLLRNLPDASFSSSAAVNSASASSSVSAVRPRSRCAMALAGEGPRRHCAFAARACPALAALSSRRPIRLRGLDVTPPTGEGTHDEDHFDQPTNTVWPVEARLISYSGEQP